MSITRVLHVPTTKHGSPTYIDNSRFKMTAVGPDHFKVEMKDPKLAAQLTGKVSDLKMVFSQIPVDLRPAKFNRALYRIALEFLCFDKGPRFALGSQFDHVRNFVWTGRGGSQVKRIALKNALNLHEISIAVTVNEIQRLVVMTICGPRFAVDLTPVSTSRDPDIAGAF